MAEDWDNGGKVLKKSKEIVRQFLRFYIIMNTETAERRLKNEQRNYYLSEQKYGSTKKYVQWLQEATGYDVIE